jgi:YggT family protein
MVLDTSVRFYEYWYFHVPNYVLAALMYSLLARFLLSFVFAPDSRNYIYRAFVRLTDPILAAVRFVTPRSVPPLLTVLLAAIWLIIVRFALLVGFITAGLAPRVAG